MAYRLKRHESVNDAVIRIAAEQMRRGMAEIDDVSLERHEAVHQVRKRCKKIRGLLRMVRPALGETYGHENDGFRNAARQLSEVRDAQTLIETFDSLCSNFGDALHPDFAAEVRTRLLCRRSEVLESETNLHSPLRSVRRVLAEAFDRSKDWKLDEKGFAAVAGGVSKTYRSGRKAMTEAYAAPTTESFHEWRKHAKYFWYQQRLLRPLWPAVFNARCETGSTLADLLGDDHDLAVLGETLLQEPEELREPEVFGKGDAMDVLLGLIQHRRLALQQQARPLGERLFAEKPKALMARLKRYYSAWQREH